MQTWLSLFSVIVLTLAGVNHGYAEEGSEGGKPVQSAQEILPEKPSGDALPRDGRTVQRVCLILPLDSVGFANLAAPVRDGFLAARAADAPSGLPVQVYSTADAPEDSVIAYRKALAEECSVIVGPLARNAVTALAKSSLVAVPTLVLNVPDLDEQQWPKPMYSFGLQVEAEARQVARYAFRDGKRRAMTVSSSSALSKRMEESFVEEWNHLGGVMAGKAALPPGKQIYPDLQEEVATAHPDVVFLALDWRKSRQARPYLGNGVAVYATSQVFGSRDGVQRNVDLNGVRFVGMPWLLQADHPAVMAYARPEGTYSLDMERMYALGIDAYRIVNGLQSGDVRSGKALDGVTGRITLGANRQFSRVLPLAEFVDGEPQLVSQAKAE